MTIQHTSHGDWVRQQPYELICDMCGRVGIAKGTFEECVFFAKENWESKSVRTQNEAQRFIFTHYCRVCKNKL